ncbi:MAG: response regulator [Sulfuriflexus sp.]|nr:response regulator [Sulfuriflexus sp.]
MKVLIAEDSALSRSVLSSILEKHDFTVIESVDGKDAVEKYIESDPDIILMDLMMPIMNGYDATKKIKELAGEKFIPIIVLTSMTETDALVKSIEYGADDYLNKPYNADAINAKILALSRIKELHDTLNSNKQKLEQLNEQAASELLVAEHIYDSVLEKGERNLPQVRQYMRPVTNFNGDILMTAYTPSGGFNVMLGDFTGHGLSAAIGAIPAAEIFYRMTCKGFSIGDIAVELNDKLKIVLPLNVFCAASLIEVDQERTTISVWNGSNPDVVITDNKGNLINRIASSHTALGIVSPAKFDRKVDMFSLDGDEHVYMCSDGLLDVRNSESIKFGMSRYIDLFSEDTGNDVGLNNIVDSLFSFAEGGEINDDISLIEIKIDKDIDTWHADNSKGAENKRLESEWVLSLSFDAAALREVNPVPLLLNFVNGINVIHGHKERIYTTLSEFFTNSLEHGLLELESSLKIDATGFQEYFSKKESRLANLQEGSIVINLSQKMLDAGWHIIIEVIDSGKGFVHNDKLVSLDDNVGFSGRGIPLVKKICESVEYNNAGNAVKAIYSLNTQL